MGAPILKVEAVDNGTAEALLSSLNGMAAVERRKHASIFNYWLSIRGNRPFPPIRDLDPLEISDAGPWSVLLELIGPGDNAVIRHLGQAIKLGVDAETIARAPGASLLACIHSKLPVVASTMQALAFDDSFETAGGTQRCWVTLLPFSASGTVIDYVYGFVSIGTDQADAGEEPDEAALSAEQSDSLQVPLRPLDEEPETAEEELTPSAAASDEMPQEADPDMVTLPEPEAVVEQEVFSEPQTESEPPAESGPKAALEPQASEQEVEPQASVEPDGAREQEPVEEEPAEQKPAPVPEPEPSVEPLSEELSDEPQSEPEEAQAQAELEPLPELDGENPPAKAGFSSKFLESLATVGGFYGRVVHAAPGDPIEEPISSDRGEEETADEFADPVLAPDPAVSGNPVDSPIEANVVEITCEAEGTLQSKLSGVRAMAEEARQAQLRSNQALYAGLSAAYDFALDAESEPEEYLRLVEGQGLKIQLRSPMKPVVKLAFADTCDETTIAELEAVLAWALKMDLPRGSLGERIEAEGGIGPILNGLGKAA